MRPLDRRDGFVLFAVAAGGALTSKLLGIELFDTVDPEVQWIVGTAGLAVGLLCAWACLRFSKVEPVHRLPGALWLILPWYFLFASQFAFIGFLLIAFEIVIGAVCMARRTQSSARLALGVSIMVRLAIFGVHHLLRGAL